MRICLILLCALAVTGCRSQEAGSADDKILYDKHGCAFRIDPGAGDISYVRRLRDADQSGCDIHPLSES